MYAVLFTRGAAKEFRNLGEADRARIKEAVDKLSGEPRPRGKTVKLRDNSYRIRVGECRLVYVVEEEDKVLKTRRAEFHGFYPWVNEDSPEGRQAKLEILKCHGLCPWVSTHIQN